MLTTTQNTSQQELDEDQRSGTFEARKGMLDLEYQHEPEKRQELQALRAHKDASDSDSDELADATGRKADAGSDIPPSKHLAAKTVTFAEGTERNE